MKKVLKILTETHHIVKILEPWGILIAVVGLLYTVIQFQREAEHREGERQVFKDTKINFAWERIEASRCNVRRNGGKGWVDWSNCTRNDIGQIRALRLIIDDQRFDLDGISLQMMYLNGAKFNGVSLKNATFAQSKLKGANFDNADLKGTDFSYTEVTEAVFSTANFDFDGIRDQFFGACYCSSGHPPQFPTGVIFQVPVCEKQILSDSRLPDHTETCEEY